LQNKLTKVPVSLINVCGISRPVLQFTRPLSLRRNFYWTLAGNFIYAASQWGMLTVLAKLGSPEMVGQFALGLAVTAPVIMLFNFQLRAVQATDAKREFLFSDYLVLRIVTTILALTVIAGTLLLTGYKGATALVILGFAAAKSFESISDVYYGLMQQRERMDRIACSMIIKGPLSLIALGVGVYLTGEVFWGVVGILFSWGLILFCYDVPNGAEILRESQLKSITAEVGDEYIGSLKLKWHPRVLIRLLWLALPLGLVMLLLSLNTNIPRYFIEHHLGSRQLGIFTAMAYLLVTGNTVVSAMGQSASPRLAKYYAGGDAKAFRALLLKLMGIGAALGTAGIFVAVIWGRELLTLLYTSEFAVRIDVFFWLMITATISYISSFLGYGMTAARYFRAQFPLFALVTACTLIGCYWMIPHSGLLGAAWSMFFAISVQFVGSAYVIVQALIKLQKGQL
jgi:O-antigen/teichoic acid export membrane protein